MLCGKVVSGGVILGEPSPPDRAPGMLIDGIGGIIPRSVYYGYDISRGATVHVISHSGRSLGKCWYAMIGSMFESGGDVTCVGWKPRQVRGRKK
jgi:hypothetical protein